MKEATKKSVTIGTPHNRDLTPEYVISLLGMLRNAPLQIGVAFYQSPLVNVGRNTIAANIRSDYLLFIDSDIEFPMWGLKRLMSHNKDIVGGMYFKKGEPHLPLVYELNGWEHKCITNPPSKLFKCDGIGTGFLLIKREVIAKLLDKKFVKANGFPFNFMQKPDGNEIGEDLAFCIRARKAGFDVWCDPSIPLKHIGDSYVTNKDYYKAMKADAKLEALPYNNDIEGWMTKEELNWLQKAAGDMSQIVEIGSWKGKSTHALLETGNTVYAVDHFKGSPGEAEHIGQKPYAAFKENVGHYPNLKVMKMSSEKAAEKFVGKADMVFIDGEHTYEAVKKDIEMWLPKCKKLICGHDFQWQGVQEAVTEKFGFVHTCGTIWYKQLDEKQGAQ